jgi:hypothetical protein
VRVAEDIGIDTVVRLARSDDTQVQRHAAGAIANLAFENAAMELRLVAEGALPPLLALARSSHPEVTSALMRAPTFLGHLAYTLWSYAGGEQHFATDSGRTVMSFSQVACEAAAALANLARNADNRQVMVEDGAVGTLLALAVSPHGETARQATRTLCNFSLSPELRDTLVQVRLCVCVASSGSELRAEVRVR